METQPKIAPVAHKTPLAGGIFLAIGGLVGPVVGGLMGQPSLGLLIGLGIGAVIAVVIWWRGRA